jgi:hypothetical protein
VARLVGIKQALYYLKRSIRAATKWFIQHDNAVYVSPFLLSARHA